ncbi:MAG: hypothetical protein R3B55_01765 [Candidatus Paceibacterota bacterium]
MKYLSYIFIFFIFGAQISFAGSLDIKISDKNEVAKVGDEILITINLDTGEDFYNAVQGRITLDNIFEIKRIITGGSIVSAWIENPSDTKNNSVDFSGIIAGGFKGEEKLFQIIVSPKYEGSGNIVLSEVSIFLNDGNGTEERKPETLTSVRAVNLSPGETNKVINLVDKISPENFEVTLIKDKNIEDGKYILIFEANDKGSGIRSYEIVEGKKKFTAIKSPYVLENQRLNERIYVTAIDHNENTRTVQVEIPGKICVGTKCFDRKIIISILGIIFIASFILWRRQSEELRKISKTSS